MSPAMNTLLFKDHREYVRFELKLRQERRPAYSMRALARDLRMSPSSLCDFLAGRVGLSRERSKVVGDHFAWPEPVREHFWDLMQAKYAKLPEARKKAKFRAATRTREASVSVPLDSFKVISEWYHLVILEIHSILGGHVDPKAVSARLNISAATVRDATDRLVRTGLLKENTEGLLLPAETDTWIGDEAPSACVRSYHAQVLGLAMKAIENVAMDERESLSLMFFHRQKRFSQNA
jgi:uncharacterized protein (TIGR02147 family)